MMLIYFTKLGIVPILVVLADFKFLIQGFCQGFCDQIRQIFANLGRKLGLFSIEQNFELTFVSFLQMCKF